VVADLGRVLHGCPDRSLGRLEIAGQRLHATAPGLGKGVSLPLTATVTKSAIEIQGMR
jgi:hypothetical protein